MLKPHAVCLNSACMTGCFLRADPLNDFTMDPARALWETRIFRRCSWHHVADVAQWLMSSFCCIQTEALLWAGEGLGTRQHAVNTPLPQYLYSLVISDSGGTAERTYLHVVVWFNHDVSICLMSNCLRCTRLVLFLHFLRRMTCMALGRWKKTELGSPVRYLPVTDDAERI